MKGLKTMKTFVKIMLFWMILGILFGLLCGCTTSGPIPIPHPIHGKDIMLVPKGTDIGGIKAPADGLYISGDRIITIPESPPESPPEPEQDKKFI